MARERPSLGPLFISLLGGFQAAGPKAANILVLERKKTRALLAMLALDLGHMVPRGKIATLLWAEQSEDTARHALRQCLLDLRQVLAKAKLEAIRAEADLIGLEPSRVVVDAARFESQIAHGIPEALEDAVALYRGDLLEGFSLKEPAFEDWHAHASPQRHCGPQAHAAGAVIIPQPQLQLAPAQRLQPHALLSTSFMTCLL